MSNIRDDILHKLIDVAAGIKAHLPATEAAELHEQITPGYTDQPLSDAEQSQLDSLLARAERLRADQAAREAAGVAPADVPADAAADVPAV